jgi:hypothetical protein
MPTPEQIIAFQKIEGILQPSIISSIYQNGTRETWKSINELIEILAPLFVVEEEVKVPKTP